MSDPIVLVHGSANGAYSWTGLLRALAPAPGAVNAPDLVGYGASPPPSPTYSIAEEVAHLRAYVDGRGLGRFHLVAHSLGSMFALHLRRALPARIARLTLIDPVVEVGVLRAAGEDAGVAEMQGAYERVHAVLPDGEAAGRVFVEHWNGAGAWDAIGAKARAVIGALMPKVGLEMTEAAFDPTPLAALVAPPHVPATILVGEHTRAAPRAYTRLLARALEARVVEVAGAGHMIPLTHPGAIARVLTVGRMTTKDEQKQRSHEAILASAARLLRDRGIRASSVGDVMKGAGLTVGGFYGHFDSKESLFAEALRSAAGTMRRRLLDSAAGDSPRARVLDVARRYLSRRHRDDVDEGCPLPAAVAEVTREGEPYRGALMGELGLLIDALTAALGKTARARMQALAIVSLLYGALSLARAAGPGKVSDEILLAARTFIADALPEDAS